MEKLTTKQENVLIAIKKYIANNGYPPTVRELGSLLNLTSTATIQSHLQTLERKGYIKKSNVKNRTLELLVPNEYDTNNPVMDIPLVGKVTAGSPIDAIEIPNEYFSIPITMIPKGKQVFALNVSGESMINAGIYDGDTIIVERRPNAENGEIVVAMNDNNEATVKRFYKEKNHIRLQPENDTMDPIILDNVTILGKVVGLYRKMK